MLLLRRAIRAEPGEELPCVVREMEVEKKEQEDRGV